MDQFEKAFEEKFGVENAVAVNSGTSALELAYDLIGIRPGDEVIVPVLTCTATNLPLIRRRAKLVFADVDPVTLTVSREDIKSKITERTRAVVVVDLHGIEATRPDFYFNKNQVSVRIPVVVDAAQALGNTGGDYTCYSFQAIKHITTGDGGMLVCKSAEDARKAKLWRWFGVDREKKLKNSWQPLTGRGILFDIDFPGYKFQMNDIAAAMGLSGLKAYDQILEHRKQVFDIYKSYNLPLVDGPSNRYGYACLLLPRNIRREFEEHMSVQGIETNVMHVRNDLYTVFKPFQTALPVMDSVEPRYICIPLHNHLSLDDAHYIGKAAVAFLHD